jgi:hypothetical protein
MREFRQRLTDDTENPFTRARMGGCVRGTEAMMQMQMQMHCKWRANSARAAWRRAKQTRTRSKPPLDVQCGTSKIADYLHTYLQQGFGAVMIKSDLGDRRQQIHSPWSRGTGTAARQDMMASETPQHSPAPCNRVTTALVLPNIVPRTCIKASKPPWTCSSSCADRSLAVWGRLHRARRDPLSWASRT